MSNNGRVKRTVELVCPHCHVAYDFTTEEIGGEDPLCIYCGTPLVWNECSWWR